MTKNHFNNQVRRLIFRIFGKPVINVLLARARSLEEAGRILQATSYWLILGKFTIPEPDIFIETALALYRLNKFHAAVKCWEDILFTHESALNAEQLSDASVCLASTGEFGLAVRYGLLAAAKASSEPVTLVNAASILVKVKDYPRALRLYEAAIQNGGEDHTTWNNIGIMLDGLGKMELALACYKRALTLASDNRSIMENLLTSLLCQGQFATALEVLEAQARCGGVNQLFYLGYKAEILSSWGKTGEAVDCYNRLLRLA